MASSYILVSIFPLLLMPFFSLCAASDPSPLQDFCIADLNSPLFVNGFLCKNPANVTSNDFFYDGFTEKPNHFDDLGVNVTQGNVRRFPGINTLGVSMNRVSILPGGLNPPHVHPRASELAVVVKGKILVGLVSTANILYWRIVSTGEMFVIPPGLVHFQLNAGQGNAKFYASFNSQNPGLQIIGNSLFNSTPSVVDEVLSKAFRLNTSTIDFIKSQFKGSK